MAPGSVSPKFQDRLGETIERASGKFGPEMRGQLRALTQPTALALMAGTLAAWVVGHAFGYGEAIDVIVAVVGVASIGLSVFKGLDELYEFASGAYFARTSSDLDRAADHFAKAITILGVQAVLAFLLKGAPKGGRLPVGPRPATAPSLVFDATLPAGEGATSFWGEIAVSTQGAKEEQTAVLLHEKVHQFFSVRLNRLQAVRLENRAGSYFNSSLYRYFEEMTAESVGQLGGYGFLKMFKGLSFPVKNGYVYWMRGGGYSRNFAGSGLLPESASLIGVGAAAGFSYELWFSPNGPTAPGQR